MPLIHRLRRLAATLALWLALMLPAQAAIVTLDEARAGLSQALVQGRADIAWHLAQGLIRADPAGYDGPAGLAQAELRLGRPALAAARAAQARARTPAQRFEAALLMAQALEAAGGAIGPVQAQFWARRAYALAPAEVYRNAAQGEVQRLRAAARLSLRLDLTVAPSDNVNNGTRATEIDFFGLPFRISAPSRALSGWIGQAALSGRWRLAESASSASHLRFALVHREVRLSADSRAALEQWRRDEAARGNTVVPQTNYDFSAVELGFGHRQRLGKGVADLGFTLGHNWFAGRDLTDYARLDLGWEQALAPRATLFAALALERQWRRDSPLRNADQVTVQLGLARQFGNGDRLRLTLGARDVASASSDVAHKGLTARLGWEKAAPLAGVRLSAALAAERRRYAASVLAPAGRRDLRLSAEVSLTFERMEVMGFAPVLDLNVSRNRSNIALHDGRDIGLTLGFRSTF